MGIVVGVRDNAGIGMTLGCLGENGLTPREAENELIRRGYVWIEKFSSVEEYEEFRNLTPYERLLQKSEEPGGYEIMKVAGCFSFV